MTFMKTLHVMLPRSEYIAGGRVAGGRVREVERAAMLLLELFLSSGEQAP